MKLPRAAQILLTIVCVAIAAGFGTSSQFYSESLSSAFFAIALVSVVIIQLRVCGLWPDALILIGLTTLLAIVDFRFLHYTPHVMAWLSFFGLNGLLLLSLRAVWSEGESRKLFVMAFVPALLFVTSEWFASNMLDLTERLHPKALDLYLYFFDGSLRVQLPFLMGQAFALWPWFKITGELFYVGLPIPIALVYSGQLIRVRERAIPAMAAFLMTGPLGILFYNIFPALGPIHLLRADFPWHPLDLDSLRRVVLEPIALRGPRNAIPSLHMGWVLLCWWYSRGLSWWERSITILFVLFTFCATIGSGEHYFIDLVVAYPFALFMQALCVWPPAWKNRAGFSALLFGLLTVLVWFGALRFAPNFFWISPIIPWTACAATVGLTLWVKSRFKGLTDLALWKPSVGENVFRRIEKSLSHFAEHKTLAVCLMFIAVGVFRLAVLPLLPVPIPGIHDEFSYLLMADTFAHGRLANATHPMWISFETFHVNWVPTYSSMYPPAQGLVLAIGQLLGNPWIGVVLSDAAMCAAILWMLQAWMPARWALLGGVFAALNLGIASYWMNSYWGGAVAAAGGALVLGALARIRRRASITSALLLGLGIAILSNSRPYEGLLFCVPSGVWLLAWLAGKIKPPDAARARTRIVLLPLSAVMVLTLAFIGYYNWRLTGNALLFPHVLNTRTYHSTPLFLWEHLKPELTYNNQQFEDFYNGWEREHYQTTWKDARDVTAEKLARMGEEFFWPGTLFLLPALPLAFRDRKMRLLVVTFFLCLAGVFAVIWSAPHYAAPLTCVIYALLAQSVRHLRAMKWKALPVGVALSRALLLLLVLSTCVSIARRSCDPLRWTCTGDPSRFAVMKQLLGAPGKHLIMVRYSDDHNIHDEWVYNGADIDGSKVIWARELEQAQNAKLFAYFKDRQIWLVEPDIDNTELKPYNPPPDQ